jgi:hypothetical protein
MIAIAQPVRARLSANFFNCLSSNCLSLCRERSTLVFERRVRDLSYLNFLVTKMCRAPSNRAAQMSLTLTRLPVVRPDTGEGIGRERD